MMNRWLNIASRMTAARERVGKTPADVVHRENKWRLLRYRPRKDGIAYRTPILMVPSLINRHYVLDLMPGKSLVEWLVKRGHDVYIIDWGTPSAEDRYLTFDDICDRYLGRATRVAARCSGCDHGVHLLGYCLGGTLAAIHAAARPEHVASLVALAAPVRFDDDGALSVWTRIPSFEVGTMVKALGNVPWQLMQATFHMLRPTLNLSKAVGVIDRAWDDEFLDGFFALETWGNDNVSFPGACYERYVEELYRGNALVKGTFTLSGRPVRLENITCPVLAVTFQHDSIVPAGSATPLMELVSSKDKQNIHLHGGHVGAVVSRKASDRLWPQLAEWWAARDGGGPAEATGSDRKAESREAPAQETEARPQA
ncbi:MAG: alpha/beta fold hydrolase [Deltaproteobacteria bacterium]|nr:alpha/beta fold hydrolase [Deltaproteobacteria bacterium]